MIDQINEDISNKSEDNVREIYPRMSLEEYENLDEGIRGELINGRFYAMSGPTATHQRISSEISTVIKNYISSKKGGCEVFYAPFDVKLYENEDTIVQPDVMVICNPDIIDENRVNGAPDLVIEIVSPNNPGHDYVKKLEMYMRAGVKEYWIVDPMEQRISVYLFGDGSEKETSVKVYGFTDDVPVGIYGAELRINLKGYAG